MPTEIVFGTGVTLRVPDFEPEQLTEALTLTKKPKWVVGNYFHLAGIEDDVWINPMTIAYLRRVD